MSKGINFQLDLLCNKRRRIVELKHLDVNINLFLREYLRLNKAQQFALYVTRLEHHIALRISLPNNAIVFHELRHLL